jgi:hypothetical protein
MLTPKLFLNSACTYLNSTGLRNCAYENNTCNVLLNLCLCGIMLASPNHIHRQMMMIDYIVHASASPVTSCWQHHPCALARKPYVYTTLLSFRCKHISRQHIATQRNATQPNEAHRLGQANRHACQQELMSSMSTRRCAFLGNQKTLVRFGQEDTYCCSTRRHVVVLHRGTCLLVEQNALSSWWTRRDAFLLSRNVCTLGQQDDMSGC